jgi:DNA repair exonuclease SbcCD ATPase subunit
MSKIKRLVIRNALGIEEKAINVGNVNIISGGNAKGKTSILEVIEKALYNTERRDRFVRIGADKAYIEVETDDGIKVERTVTEDGKNDVKVTRDGIPVRAPQTFLDQLFGVTKERKDVFAFNPVDFMLKPAKEQSKILLSLMPIMITQQDMMNWFGKIPPVNPNMHGLLVLKELEKYWYDARHEANGAVRATQAEVEALQKQLPDNYEVEKWENFSTMALSDEIRKGEQVNNFRKQAQELIDGLETKKQNINNKYDLQVKEQEELLEFKINKVNQSIEQQKQAIRNEIEKSWLEIDKHNAEIERLQKLIEAEEKAIVDIKHNIELKQKDLENFDISILATKTESLTNEMNIAVKAINENRQRELVEAEDRVKKAEQYLAENSEVDIAPLEEKYREAEKMKGFVEMAHNLQNVQERLQREIELAEKYDEFVQFCRNKPAELLKTIQLPVPGLGIDDNGNVTIDGLPIKNLNTAKQVTVCIDIAKAYAKDNPMKLICVDKIEHLDATTREEFFRQIEADNEYQYFVTWVTDGEMQIDTIGQV